MKISGFFGFRLALAGLTFAAACSDDSGDENGGGAKQRATILNRSPGQIAVAALSDVPDPDFVAARNKVQRGVTAERGVYARRFVLGAGRGAAIVNDPSIRESRTLGSIALGTSLDLTKETDVAAAQLSIDTLLAEMIKVLPGATSCEMLPAPKNDACAYALIIMEILRSEAPFSDAGVGVADAGVADSATADSGLSDAGPSGPVSLFQCGARDLSGAYEPKTRIEASETWSGKVLVKGATYAVGATITIMPGTEIFMDVDSTLEIGWNSSEGAILAEGTAAAPIRFCGKTAEKGYWGGITLGRNVTSNSVMRNVLISDGAGAEAALQLEADITIDNVQVRNGEKDGVWALDFKEDSRNLTVEGVGASAVVLTGQGAVTRFPLGGMLINNVENQAIVRFSSLDANTTFHNLGIPYLQERTVTQSAGEVTFEAGVDYRFKPDVELAIGWNSASAGVHANGTAAAPVRFGSWQANTSQWTGITIGSNVTTDSNLTYVEIRQAGSKMNAALEIGAAVLLDNVKLEDNLTGVQIAATGLAAGSKNLTITKTKGRPLSIVPDGVFTLPQGGTFTGNEIDQIEVKGTTFNKSGTINDVGIPYYLTGAVVTYGGSNIVVAAGTDFVMGVDSSLEVGWNSGTSSFIADGTEAAPITFTGATATAGSWRGITVGRNVLSNSLLNYVQIGHAGGPTSAPGSALELDVGIPVTNSKFYQSVGWGITRPESITVDYGATNTFEACTLGTVGPR